MIDLYLAIVLTTFASVLCGLFIIRISRTHHWLLDVPNQKPRKLHARATPLLGGSAVIIAFSLGLILLWPALTGGYLLPKHLLGLLLGGFVLLVGGAWDDIFTLPPKWQMMFPLLAAVIIVASGMGIEFITNPLGGVWRLDAIEWTFITVNGVPYQITLLADLFTVAWLMGTMYTTKLLDGLDGLVSGIVVIGALILYWLSMTPEVGQPETARIAAIAASAFFGFLLLNWHPAKIFLGESGSLFAGFVLGVLAIISGGKIATALLILGIPILDVCWVIVRRIVIEKKSIASDDRKHLHFRLVDIGLSQRQAVLLLYVLTAVFGTSSLVLESSQKALALILLIITMCILASIVVWKYNQKVQKNET